MNLNDMTTEQAQAAAVALFINEGPAARNEVFDFLESYGFTPGKQAELIKPFETSIANKGIQVGTTTEIEHGRSH